uniref:Protein krueppel n=1 Tax=Anopheles dirus TaxID=7168 RepID=A0A182NYB9_9DIPT
MNVKKCRLCLEEVNADNIGSSILEKPFREATDRVFSFQITHKKGLPMDACKECTQNVLSFHKYSDKVQRNQEILDNECLSRAIIDEGSPINNNNGSELIKTEPLDSDSENSLIIDEARCDAESGLMSDTDDNGRVDNESQPDFEYDSLLSSAFKCEDYTITPADSTPSDASWSRKRTNNDENVSPDDGEDAHHDDVPEQKKRALRMRVTNNTTAGPVAKDTVNSEKVSAKQTSKKPPTKQCPVCDRFIRKSFFATHLAGHEGVFPCELCDKKYTTNRALKRHKDAVHFASTADDQAFACDECDSTFSFEWQLSEHGRDHQTKPCPVCKKQIKEKQLKKHIAGHEGYRCDECDKSFGFEISLKRHKAVHHASSSTQGTADVSTGQSATAQQESTAEKAPPRRTFNITSDTDRERIIAAYIDGASGKTISQILNIKIGTVYGIIKKYQVSWQMESKNSLPRTLRPEIVESVRSWMEEDASYTKKELADRVYYEYRERFHGSAITKALKQINSERK